MYDFGLNDYATSIYPTKDSCYIICANWQSPSSDYNISILKIDENGDTIWTKKYGDSLYNEYINDVVIKEDNSMFIVGQKIGDTSHYSPRYDVWLIYADFNGNILWDSTYDFDGGYGNDYGKSIIIDSRDNILLAGRCDYNGASNALIMSFDSLINLLWYDYFGGSQSPYSRGYGLSICETCDYHYLISGYIYGAIGHSDFGFIRKYDSLGNGFPSLTFVELFIRDLVISFDSCYVFIAQGINEAVITKINEIYLFWQLSFDNTVFNALERTLNNNYVATGKRNGSLYFLKFSDSGDTIWSAHAQPNSSEGFSVCNSHIDGYIVVGEIENNNKDIYIAKFNDPVGVEEIPEISEFKFQIIQSHGIIKLAFYLDSSEFVSLKVFDLSGRLVFENNKSNYRTGYNEIDFNLSQQGIFICQLNIGEKIYYNKLTNLN